MKRIGFVVLLAALTGCGVDGAPIRPTADTYVGIGSNGVNVGTNVSATAGNVSVGVGLGL